MIPTNRQEKYNDFALRVIKSYGYTLNKVEWETCLHYLEYGGETVPTLHPTIFDIWDFSDLYRLLAHPQDWSEFDDRIMGMMSNFWKTSPSTPSHSVYYLTPQRLVENWLYNLAPYQNRNLLSSAGRILEKFGINEANLGINLLYYAIDAEQLTPVGEYILSIIDKMLELNPKADNYYLFQLLMKYDEQTLDKNLTKIVTVQDSYLVGFDHIPRLLAHNAPKYEAYIALTMNRTNINVSFQTALILNHFFPQKYDDTVRIKCYEYLEFMEHSSHLKTFYFDWFNNIIANTRGTYIETVFTELYRLEPSEKVFEVIQNTLLACSCTSKSVVTLVYQWFGEKSLPILVDALSKRDCFQSMPETAILEYLKNHNHTIFYPQIWDSLSKTEKKRRSAIAQHLAIVQGEAAIPNAENLLQDKKADIRMVGVLILSVIKTEKSLAILRGVVNTEKNDDARDAMLEGLADLISRETDETIIFDSIEQAKLRGKLEKPLTNWLDTEGVSFPKLTLISGQILEKEAVDFLFYRMSRTKDIRIDMEAKPLLTLIDKSKSAPFAKVLLKKYFENGADAKLKWCMTLGSILGSDDEMDTIKRKVNEWAEASRGKMAEYAVKALAMNGSTRALRAVEFFSRKYKSKNKNIGAAAIESFAITAEELGISPYDLADSIIPDFGFEGLFKEFEAGGETYRAFVGSDFKIAFLNEDNRTLKALPKGASAALKEEFKDIAKEIRDIVKSQSSRLEQYLVIQRKWSVAKWDAFFRGNPVMFAYAIRAIWGIFDEKQQIITTFQCLEDQSLVNIEGDEFDLDDYTEGGQIGMVHPMQLTQEQINHWKDALTDADVQPIFPQLDRPVILLHEANKHVKMCTEFQGIQYGGYGFVSKMEKLGWFRGSVVDAGGISSYYKDFSELGVTAIIMQVGMIGVGYYEENAELGDLMFVKSKAVSFGSYSYDEPSKSDDARLMTLGDVPPIVYSEVMADMLFFKENQVKKAT